MGLAASLLVKPPGVHLTEHFPLRTRQRQWEFLNPQILIASTSSYVYFCEILNAVAFHQFYLPLQPGLFIILLETFTHREVTFKFWAIIWVYFIFHAVFHQYLSGPSNCARQWNRHYLFPLPLLIIHQSLQHPLIWKNLESLWKAASYFCSCDLLE